MYKIAGQFRPNRIIILISCVRKTRINKQKTGISRDSGIHVCVSVCSFVFVCVCMAGLAWGWRRGGGRVCFGERRSQNINLEWQAKRDDRISTLSQLYSMSAGDLSPTPNSNNSTLKLISLSRALSSPPARDPKGQIYTRFISAPCQRCQAASAALASSLSRVKHRR